VIIHLTLLVSALAVAASDRLLVNPERIKAQH